MPNPLLTEQGRKEHLVRLAAHNSKRMRAEGERDCIIVAGGDPDTAKGKDRKALIERGRKIKAREKSRKQAVVKAMHARRHREAMPSWADKQAIAAVYAEAIRITAETGIPHEVDHIEPLLGQNASGLHVHYNLRVITRTENRRKGNRRAI
jgi:hypothetical protein